MERVETFNTLITNCENVSLILKSISHPVRLKILCLLMDQERSVNDLTEICDISQSAMSQFLKRMKSEGVLESRREHNFIFYRIADKKIIRLLRVLKEIYC